MPLATPSALSRRKITVRCVRSSALSTEALCGNARKVSITTRPRRRAMTGAGETAGVLLREWNRSRRGIPPAAPASSRNATADGVRAALPRNANRAGAGRDRDSRSARDFLFGVVGDRGQSAVARTRHYYQQFRRAALRKASPVVTAGHRLWARPGHLHSGSTNQEGRKGASLIAERPSVWR